MKQNMGKTQRIIRTVVGLAVIGAGVYYHHWFGFLGVILVLSAAIGYCPLCCIGGKSCEMKKDVKDEHKHGEGCCHH